MSSRRRTRAVMGSGGGADGRCSMSVALRARPVGDDPVSMLSVCWPLHNSPKDRARRPVGHGGLVTKRELLLVLGLVCLGLAGLVGGGVLRLFAEFLAVVGLVGCGRRLLGGLRGGRLLGLLGTARRRARRG